MIHKDTCKHCGHVRVAYTHRINQQLVASLAQIVDFYEKKRHGANLQKDLSLNKNQYNNFQKLQYFKLVTRGEHGWFPTNLGTDFIYGEAFIFDYVITVESEIKDYDHPFYRELKNPPKLISVREVDISSWKKREDYQLEKSSQMDLFSLN